MYIFCITAKLAIFFTDMLWESCSEFNLEQLSHSMFCKNIAHLAVAMETCFPLILAKRAIFLRNIPWESCSKLNSEQLSHSMSVANIANLAVITIAQQKIAQLSVVDY